MAKINVGESWEIKPKNFTLTANLVKIEDDGTMTFETYINGIFQVLKGKQKDFKFVKKV